MRLLARPIYSIGAAGLIFGIGLLHRWYLAPDDYIFFGWGERGWWWAVYAIAQLTISYAIGLPDLARSRTGAALRGLAATVAAFLVISTFQAVLATPLLPRSSSGLLLILLPVWAVLAWNLGADATARAETRDRVFLVVDREEDARSVEADLQASPESPGQLVGIALLDEVRAAGTGPFLERRAIETGATILVLDAASQSVPSVVEQAAELHRTGIRVRTLSLFYEEWIGKLPHTELARVSLLFDIGELHRIRYVRAKRAVDLLFAVVGMVVLLPLAAIALTVNPFGNPGPLIYRQPRVGRDGEEFVIYKLRTMTDRGQWIHRQRVDRSEDLDTIGTAAGPDAVPDDNNGASRWTAENDPRITAFGGLLRRTHLDELPQVINILRGDLSLVGPRPEQPGYVADLSDKIAFYDVRHIVRPGLTGWAQIKQGYAADQSDALEKLQYDFYYLRRQGFGLDAKIIGRTLRQVTRGAGR
ncbi:MAG: sugar transferase [Actinomycetota bacterium]